MFARPTSMVGVVVSDFGRGTARFADVLGESIGVSAGGMGRRGGNGACGGAFPAWREAITRAKRKFNRAGTRTSL
eukprot:4311772-Pleurochrysis_carterae.AAC.1